MSNRNPTYLVRWQRKFNYGVGLLYTSFSVTVTFKTLNPTVAIEQLKHKLFVDFSNKHQALSPFDGVGRERLLFQHGAVMDYLTSKDSAIIAEDMVVLPIEESVMYS